MNVLILGANSEIALALAHLFARKDKADLFLASRGIDELGKNCKDIAIRYQVRAEPLFFDALDYSGHHDFYQNLPAEPDVVVLAFGYLGSQKKGQVDFVEAKKIVESNYLGAVSILEIIAADFEKRKTGKIIILSSVAGDRGRKKNYLYGSAKAGLTTYASGLRNGLFASNVKVLTVLPGFVKTKMTYGMDLPEKLLAEPEQVARDIYKSVAKKDVIYTKKIWRLIMAVIRAIPEFQFKKTDI